MTILYIANKNYSSWSLRSWLLMKELGIPFQEHMLPFGDHQAWTEFRARGGNGKVPTLQDGDVQVWDSLAITEYLAEHYPQVWPSDMGARAWARSTSAEMHSGFQALRDLCSMNIGVKVNVASIPETLARDVERINAIWQEGLSRFGGPFLAGARFTAVDAFYAPVVFRFETYGLERSPSVADYLQRMLALPGMQTWAAQALQEPWIDSSHETDCERIGVIVEDLRRPKSR